jgi:hypothetical protein
VQRFVLCAPQSLFSQISCSQPMFCTLFSSLPVCVRRPSGWNQGALGCPVGTDSLPPWFPGFVQHVKFSLCSCCTLCACLLYCVLDNQDSCCQHLCYTRRVFTSVTYYGLECFVAAILRLTMFRYANLMYLSF